MPLRHCWDRHILDSKKTKDGRGDNAGALSLSCPSYGNVAYMEIFTWFFLSLVFMGFFKLVLGACI